MKAKSPKIGTWPTPEKPISVEIPLKFLAEFEKEARVVIRHPFVVGIPIPMKILEKIQKDPGLYKDLTKDFDIMIVPK